MRGSTAGSRITPNTHAPADPCPLSVQRPWAHPMAVLGESRGSLVREQSG